MITYYSTPKREKRKQRPSSRSPGDGLDDLFNDLYQEYPKIKNSHYDEEHDFEEELSNLREKDPSAKHQTHHSHAQKSSHRPEYQYGGSSKTKGQNVVEDVPIIEALSPTRPETGDRAVNNLYRRKKKNNQNLGTIKKKGNRSKKRQNRATRRRGDGALTARGGTKSYRELQVRGAYSNRSISGQDGFREKSVKNRKLGRLLKRRKERSEAAKLGKGKAKRAGVYSRREVA